MVGRLLLQAKMRFGHGPRVAYYRDVVRPRILRSGPVERLNDERCEIHVLTSAGDWLNLCWALRSFYWASGRRYRLCIHDDGTLPAEGAAQLARLFPAARIVLRPEADARVLPQLVEFPRCRQFRETNHLSPKLFDFRSYLTADRMLLLDSDVLFFEEPTELLRRIESPDYRLNSVNADVESAYTIEPTVVHRECGFELIDRFNSGLGVIHRDSLRLDWLEEFLGLDGVRGHFWRIEQTLFALCSCRYGVELLPAEYRISLAKGTDGCVAKHYVGAVRQLMYREGIKRLAAKGMLKWGAIATPATGQLA